MDDAEEMFIQIRKRNLDIPIITFGHSLGGCIALNYLCNTHGKEIKLAIISSPWLKTVIKPPRHLLIIQKLLCPIFPSLTLNNRIDPTDLSKNKSIVRKYINDPLVHSKISLNLFSEVNNAIKTIEKMSFNINIPILLTHGKKDRIMSYKGTKNISKKIKNSQFKLWESVYHEPHNDIEKNQILEHFLEFINRNIKFQT